VAQTATTAGTAASGGSRLNKRVAFPLHQPSAATSGAVSVNGPPLPPTLADAGARRHDSILLPPPPPSVAALSLGKEISNFIFFFNLNNLNFLFFSTKILNGSYIYRNTGIFFSFKKIKKQNKQTFFWLVFRYGSRSILFSPDSQL
jgi:hypothetical protein